jgi:hypothetical protein
MKTRNKSKLFAAVAMLVVSAVAVTSASFAWFTMTREVTATDLSLTAAAPANVQIAIGTGVPAAEDWASTVTLTSTAKFLRPASTATAFNSSFFDNELNAVLIDDENKTNAFRAVSNPVGEEKYQYYYDVSLWFRAKGTYDIDLALKTLALEASNLSGAVRVAFVNVDGDGNSYNEDTSHLIFAGANTAYNAATGASTIAEVTPKVAGTQNVAKVLVDKANVNTYTGASKNVIARIYLEGQDAACINANALNALSVALTFNSTEITS